MKKVLVITYYWPPSGGAAVQRWLSFSNHLHEQGAEVYVLTVDENYATFQLFDPKLVDEINPGIHVHKTRTSEPFALYKKISGKKSVPKPAFSDESNPSFMQKVFRFIRGNFFVPDPRKGWKKHAKRKAAKLIATFGINNVITAGPPHSTHFIGLELKKRFAVQWIADFHDLWTDVIYYKQLYHLPFIARLDARMERSILEAADKVLTVGDLYKDKLLSKSTKLDPRKFKIARMGFDRIIEAGPARQGKPFTIAYTGTMADFYEPGVFFEALKNLREEMPELDLRFEIAGVLSPGIREMIEENGLNALVRDHGYVSHSEVENVLKRADALLLVNPVTENEAMVIPGKIYEYIATGRPVINITVHGAETEKILAEANAGRTFERKEKEALFSYMKELVQAWKLGTPRKGASSESIGSYSRGSISAEIMSLLK